MRYLITRHAQTLANSVGEFPGLDEPLSELGAKQAENLAHFLSGETFDTLVHSGSVRTVATAQLMLPTLQVGQVVEDPRTLEGAVGEWVGKRASMRAETARDCGVPIWEVRPPGGESYLDIDARLRELVEDLWSGSYGANVLLVGHGRLNGLLIRVLLGTPWPQYRPQQMHHTGVTEVELGPTGVRVARQDDTSHLPPEMVTR